MIKLRMTIVFLALWGVLNGWGQGFGNRELINVDWYFNLGDIKYGGAEFSIILNGGNLNCLMIGVWNRWQARVWLAVPDIYRVE